jgi:hypothetical protein
MSYTIELRENNGGTYLVLLKGKIVASKWDCTPEDIQNFVSDSDPAEWDDQMRYADPELAVDTPESFGELLATRKPDGELVINDESSYAERLAFFGVQS